MPMLNEKQIIDRSLNELINTFTCAYSKATDRTYQRFYQNMCICASEALQAIKRVFTRLEALEKRNKELESEFRIVVDDEVEKRLSGIKEAIMQHMEDFF